MMPSTSDPLDIPGFLRRRSDETPSITITTPTLLPPEPLPRDPKRVAIEQQIARQKRMSWEKRKGVLADQQAAAEGKVWDPIKGGWRKP